MERGARRGWVRFLRCTKVTARPKVGDVHSPSEPNSVHRPAPRRLDSRRQGLLWLVPAAQRGRASVAPRAAPLVARALGPPSAASRWQAARHPRLGERCEQRVQGGNQRIHLGRRCAPDSRSPARVSGSLAHRYPPSTTSTTPLCPMAVGLAPRWRVMPKSAIMRPLRRSSRKFCDVARQNRASGLCRARRAPVCGHPSERGESVLPPAHASCNHAAPPPHSWDVAMRGRVNQKVAP